MRHLQLLSADNTALLVIDIQDAFVEHIHEMDRVIKRSRILIEAARLLELPIIVSQQYPKGLGQTVEPLRQALADSACTFDKVTFSCCQDEPLTQAINNTDRQQILICGIETHVCVLQTAFDLLAMDKQPYIATDATSSRNPTDAQVAQNRMSQAGIIPTTTESAIMELTLTSKHTAFKDLSKLIK